jgi:Flp pilus assembly protein TadG
MVGAWLFPTNRFNLLSESSLYHRRMSLTTLCRRFAADRTGAVAIIFGLAVMPLTIAIGAAVDYSRASSLRADLQAGVDAAALAVGRVAIETGRTDNTAQARQVFDAVFKRNDGTAVARFAVTQNQEKIVVDADARVPLVFAGLLNMAHIDVNAQAVVPLTPVTVEVALVLDNTGSMNAANKLTFLKDAANRLIDKLANASVVNFHAFVAIVPFTTQIRFPNVTLGAQPPTPTSYPGLRINHPKDAAETKLRVTFTTPHPTTGLPVPTPWLGCLVDRDQPHDADGFDAGQGTPLNRNLPETLMPAAHCDHSVDATKPLIAPIRWLSNDFPGLRTHINSMVGSGNTNTGIGMTAGLAMLTPNIGDMPTGAKPAGTLTRKHIVFLTDGANTENRRYGPSQTAQIDQRTAEMCAEIRRSNLNIIVHTIHLVDTTPATVTLLRNCATTPDRYRHVAQPADLNGVFDEIASELLSLRLAY